MQKRLEKLLGISGNEAGALAELISEKMDAITDENLSRKKKLKQVLKELKWTNKNIEHFVYGPPKKAK